MEASGSNDLGAIVASMAQCIRVDASLATQYDVSWSLTVWHVGQGGWLVFRVQIVGCKQQWGRDGRWLSSPWRVARCRMDEAYGLHLKAVVAHMIDVLGSFWYMSCGMCVVGCGMLRGL